MEIEAFDNRKCLAYNTVYVTGCNILIALKNDFNTMIWIGISIFISSWRTIFSLILIFQSDNNFLISKPLTFSFLEAF